MMVILSNYLLFYFYHNLNKNHVPKTLSALCGLLLLLSQRNPEVIQWFKQYKSLNCKNKKVYSPKSINNFRKWLISNILLITTTLSSLHLLCRPQNEKLILPLSPGAPFCPSSPLSPWTPLAPLAPAFPALPWQVEADMVSIYSWIQFVLPGFNYST